MSHDWCQTWPSGIFRIPAEKWMFNVEAIAHSLARKCRYNGHVIPENYSVAEHSVLLSNWFQDQNDMPHARSALFHDAVESGLQDLPAPLKPLLPDYRKLESDTEHVIYEWFVELVYPLETVPFWDPLIKSADSRIVIDEKAQVLATSPIEWQKPQGGPLGVRCEGLLPYRAEKMFLDRYYEICVP